MLDQHVLTLATVAAGHLRRRGETIAIAESSTGGLITAALLAVPGKRSSVPTYHFRTAEVMLRHHEQRST